MSETSEPELDTQTRKEFLRKTAGILGSGSTQNGQEQEKWADSSIKPTKTKTSKKQRPSSAPVNVTTQQERENNRQKAKELSDRVRVSNSRGGSRASSRAGSRESSRAGSNAASVETSPATSRESSPARDKKPENSVSSAQTTEKEEIPTTNSSDSKEAKRRIGSISPDASDSEENPKLSAQDTELEKLRLRARIVRNDLKEFRTSNRVKESDTIVSDSEKKTQDESLLKPIVQATSGPTDGNSQQPSKKSFQAVANTVQKSNSLRPSSAKRDPDPQSTQDSNTTLYSPPDPSSHGPGQLTIMPYDASGQTDGNSQQQASTKQTFRDAAEKIIKMKSSEYKSSNAKRVAENPNTSFDSEDDKNDTRKQLIEASRRLNGDDNFDSDSLDSHNLDLDDVNLNEVDPAQTPQTPIPSNNSSNKRPTSTPHVVRSEFQPVRNQPGHRLPINQRKIQYFVEDKKQEPLDDMTPQKESWSEWYDTNFSKWLPVQNPFESNSETTQKEFDTYGESSFGFCCIYVTMSFIVGMLCIIGLVAWLDVNVQGVDKGVIVRKNYINLECINDPTQCKPMNKTHQCVHAFALEHDPESISVNTPFLPINMMTKRDILRNMKDITGTDAKDTAYTVYDLSVINANLKSFYEILPDRKEHIITFGQTQQFCPTVSTTGQSEECNIWSNRVESEQMAHNNNSWLEFKKDNSGCKQYDTTYGAHPDYAQVVCKTMRTPRMALTHVQNNMYNLFSAQNEMSLVVCWNAVCLVFSFVVFVYVSVDYRKQQKQKAKTVENIHWTFLNGCAQFLVTVTALFVLGCTLGLMTQRNASRSSHQKDSLFPTGSIIITVISGGSACLLVLCSPFYVQGYVHPKTLEQLPDSQPRIYTNITWERYARFLLSRNDLCIAYCNFLTFPILVLIIYVRYNWYSVDVHIQRAFFSAVAVGVLNITEVSVMGLMSLITEIDEIQTRKKFLLKYEEDEPRITFNHSNLINLTSQLIFFLSKMAVFIPTVSQIRRDTMWLHGSINEQFKGQKDGRQPLIDVTLAFFAINQTLPLLQCIVVNLGLPNSNTMLWIRKMDAKLFTFTLMNLAVVLILNFTTH
jgi:hypothetical protein